MKVFAFAGYSGSGKTTLLECVIPLLVRAGARLALIKHAHHHFDIDQPGKDSYRLRAAGCAEVLISSNRRWAIMHELAAEAEPTLQQLLTRVSPCDLVLVEGYKSEPVPKLEVHRAASGLPLLFPHDANIIAVATDEALDTRLPQLDVNNAREVADFVLRYNGLKASAPSKKVAAA